MPAYLLLYLLLTTYCLLVTAYCLLLTAYCLLRTAYYLLATYPVEPSADVAHAIAQQRQQLRRGEGVPGEG